MKIICDTNVLLSGFLFGGHCRQIIVRVSEGKDDGFISSSLLAELEGVLVRPKFGLEAAQIAAIIDLVRQTFVLVSPVESVQIVEKDPDDDAVLEAALAAGAEVVVSGDSHLLDLKGFRGIQIVSPASFLDEIRRQRAHAAGR
jgi:hypothetical protein